MPRVIAERDRLSIRRAQPALCAEDEKLFASRFGGIPSHAHVLTQAEDVAAGPLAQHFGVEWQAARRAGCFRRETVDVVVTCRENVVARTHSARDYGTRAEAQATVGN